MKSFIILMLVFLSLPSISQSWKKLWLFDSPYVTNAEIDSLFSRADRCFPSDFTVRNDSKDDFISLGRMTVIDLVTEMKEASEKVISAYYGNRVPGITKKQLRFIRDRVTIKWLLEAYGNDGPERPSFYIPNLQECFKSAVTGDKIDDDLYDNFIDGILKEVIYDESNNRNGYKYNSVLCYNLYKFDDVSGTIMRPNPKMLDISMYFYTDNKKRDVQDYKYSMHHGVLDSDVTATCLKPVKMGKTRNFTGD